MSKQAAPDAAPPSPIIPYVSSDKVMPELKP